MNEAFELRFHTPSPAAAGLVARIAGYRETGAASLAQREAASLVVPLVISLGSPFSIALGRAPDNNDRQPSFAAGLFAGPVFIESDGAAECVQIDFTPLGAYRFFGPAVAELTSAMVDMEAVLGPEAVRLRQRLGETPSWTRRFELVEAFVLARAFGAGVGNTRTGHPPSPEIDHAWRRLTASRGETRVTDLAGDIGWSRKHFVQRFAREIGIVPKTAARMIRFNHACALAMQPSAGDWASVAADAGYADQPHLIREFAEFAGETPTAWARRMATPGAGPLRDLA